MTMTSLEQIPAERVRNLLDRQEILDCLHRCARGMDRHDAELIASAYHPDGWDDHGMFRGSASEFVDYVNGTATDEGVHAAQFRTHQHLLSNHVVEINGDDAHSETHYLFIGHQRHVDSILLAAGRYIDHLQRRDGQWRIAVRRVVMECMTELEHPIDMTSGPLLAFTRGTWDHTDVSWERPLTVRSSPPT